MWQLSALFLKHPLLIVPTLKATQQTFSVCNELYGNEHHKSNIANAFRHALWNLLICKKSQKNLKSKQKSVFWAQKVTTLYEKVTRNSALDEAMDLHNNAIGRLCFFKLLEENEAKMVEYLQKKTETAKKVSTIEEMLKLKLDLVYLEELND